MSGLPPGLLLFDTGIYIRFSRQERYLWLGEDGRVFQRTILTAVVAAELYAGTRDTREKRALDQLCQAHLTLNHFSYPSASTWIDTGTLLCRARKLEAARADATLVTENFRDFERWKRLLASTGKNSEAIQSNVNRGLRSKPPA
jgi:predicted nucleic acid-binding protein